MPQLVNQGGRVQAHPVFIPVTWDGDSYRPLLDDFVARISTSTYFSQLPQYGVLDVTASPPVHVSVPLPTAISGSALEAGLVSRFDGTHPEFPAPTLDSQYLLFTPATTTIYDATEQSCVDYAAFHAFVVATNGEHISYSLLPHCKGYGTLSDLDSLTEATSHEMVEAATDPDTDPAAYAWSDTNAAGGAWDDYSNGGEVGDLCQFGDQVDIIGQDLPYIVQRYWSNTAAAAGHDPCVPALFPSEPYFAAAPVLPDDVIVHTGYVDFPGKGVKIPVGQSRTIEVDLFSDAPAAPWIISARGFVEDFGEAPELAFQLDRDHGQNGEKVHLKITVLRSGVAFPAQELFTIVSSREGTYSVWPVLVDSTP